MTSKDQGLSFWRQMVIAFALGFKRPVMRGRTLDCMRREAQGISCDCAHLFCGGRKE